MNKLKFLLILQEMKICELSRKIQIIEDAEIVLPLHLKTLHMNEQTEVSFDFTRNEDM